LKNGKETIPEGIRRLAQALAKPAGIPDKQPATMQANADAFSAAWVEARLARYSGEPIPM